MITTVDRIIVDYFNGLWNSNGWGNFILILFSLLLTILLAGFVGYEREYQGHAAGLRTHILVAVGSAIIMIVSIYGYGYENRDTMRLAAQVVTGIGFLGAGTIIQTGTDIKGLTTATTIWMVMAIGLACGAGSFTIAVLGSIFAIISLVCLKPIEKFASKRHPVLLIVLPSHTPVLHIITSLSQQYDIHLKSFDTQFVDYRGKEGLRMVVRFTPCKYEDVVAFKNELEKSVEGISVKIC